MKESCLRFNIPTISIIIKWKKDFANFGLEGLKPKQRGRPISMSDYKRKKRKSDKPLTREEELLKENERLRCENALLKKLDALIQARRNPKP
jgi:transposase